MRRLLPLVLLLCAAPAFAFSYNPSYMELMVGETGRAFATTAGFGLPLGAPSATFDAEPAGIVSIVGGISSPGYSGTIEITGVAPGTARIFVTINGARTPVGLVQVSACEGVKVEVPSVIRAKENEEVTIVPKTTGAAPVRYEWYRGLIGDTREPLRGGILLFYTPKTAGTHPIWLRVSDRCSTTTLQLRIETGPTKARAVRR